MRNLCRRGRMCVSTFSIVARDPENGDLGVAVASKFLAAGAVVPFMETGVGALAIQSFPDLSYAPRGLGMMRRGLSAKETLHRLISADPEKEGRQAGVVDANGMVSAYTGESCVPWAGHRVGKSYSCQGNILKGPGTLEAMAAGFEGAAGELSSRLLAALCAGDQAGGDRRGKQSAALFVVRKNGGYLGTSDVLVDLRVDDAPEPCGELQRLYDLHQFYFGSSPEAEKLKIEGELVRELQDILQRAGYYGGDITGELSEDTKNALFELSAIENLEERVDLERLTIDPPALKFVRDKFGGIKT